MGLTMDSGRAVSIDPKQHPHLDHGYAVTSHSSQGQTAGRVLIHIDTELGARDLLNNRMAYVAVSRGAHDAQIFTSDRGQLPQALSRDVSKQSAYVPEVARAVAPAVEAEKQAKPVEKVYTWAEHQRHWTPLNQAVTPTEAKQFGWIAETGSVQSYWHNETGKHLHIDGPSGKFFNGQRQEISARQALDHALPAGQGHSHSREDVRVEKSVEGRGFGIGR